MICSARPTASSSRREPAVYSGLQSEPRVLASCCERHHPTDLHATDESVSAHDFPEPTVGHSFRRDEPSRRTSLHPQRHQAAPRAAPVLIVAPCGLRRCSAPSDGRRLCGWPGSTTPQRCTSAMAPPPAPCWASPPPPLHCPPKEARRCAACVPGRKRTCTGVNGLAFALSTPTHVCIAVAAQVPKGPRMLHTHSLQAGSGCSSVLASEPAAPPVGNSKMPSCAALQSGLSPTTCRV